MFAGRPATLVYLDPPYFVKRDHGYAIDANDRDFHNELLDICIKAEAQCLDQRLRHRTLSKNAQKEGRLEENLHCPKTHTRDTSGKDYAKTEMLSGEPRVREGEGSGESADST